MPNTPLGNAIQLGYKKAKTLRLNPLQFLTKTMLAGVYIGFAVIFSFRTADYFYGAGSPATTLIGGATFALALILIVIGQADLFTGNTMYLTMSTMEKKTSVKDLFNVWTITWIGNLLGVILFTYFFIQTGLFNDIAADHYLITSVEKKMGLAGSEIFFRGILCNWLVCLAIWIPLQTDNYAAKVMLIIICVTGFFASGYEHSVANMSLFATALSVPHPETITIAKGMYNLVFSTLGNIVGGALFVGAAYVYINKPLKEKVKVEKAQKMIEEECKISEAK